MIDIIVSSLFQVFSIGHSTIDDETKSTIQDSISCFLYAYLKINRFPCLY